MSTTDPFVNAKQPTGLSGALQARRGLGEKPSIFMFYEIPPRSLFSSARQALDRSIREQGRLGAVDRLELFHDVLQVNLHGAFLHTEFIGDHFVRFASQQKLNHLPLSRCENFATC